MGLDGSVEVVHKLFTDVHPATKQVITTFVEDRMSAFGHDELPKHLQAVCYHTVTTAVEQSGQFIAALLADTPSTLETQNVS
jgi:hypothetical protein